MTKTQKLFAAYCSLVLATLACIRTGLPTKAPGLSAGESTRTLTHDGLERSYILHVPVSVDWNRPVPLVFAFHGGTGNAESASA